MLEGLTSAVVILLLLFMFRSKIYTIFFVALLTTEFYYILIGGGIARIYHLLVIFVLLSLCRFLPRLFSSRIFLSLSFFLIVNLIAALFSDTPTEAMTSLLLLAANMGIAMATALILISGTINIQSLKRLIFTVTVISVAWGLVQAITFHFSGIILALSDAQVSQIIGGFGPGFRTEANTFAKYLNFSFFLFLPTLIKGKLCKKNSLILSVMIVGILLTFTRSAIYGMGATLSFIFIWYIFKSRGTLITRKFLVLFLCGGISIYIFTGFVGNINPYAFYKIQNFFNKEEILEGGSSQFRLMSQKRLIDAFLASDKSIIIGTGWGQVRYIYGGKIWQAGGGELITTLTYGGLFAGLAYLLYLFTSFTAAYKMAQLHRNQEDGLTYEGVAFAVLNSFVTGQINGALIAPEYWLLIGMAMHLSVMPRSTPPQRKLFFGNAVYKKT